MATVSSRQHALVKVCRAIARGDDVRLLLDGWHLVEDALAAGLPLEWIAVDDRHDPAESALLARARAAGVSVVDVTVAVMEAMSPVRSASGVVAVAARPMVEARALVAPSPALVVAAFGVQDPGNVGALVRSVDAGGGTGVLLDDAAADPWGWKALRASMGSGFRLPVRRDATALERLREWQRDGIEVVAAVPRDGTLVYDLDLTTPLVLVLGAEGAGVPNEVAALADRRVRVPMRARVDSLNVGVAGAVLVYEAARQRGSIS
jgi:TrmH family RNA methyltransferase